MRYEAMGKAHRRRLNIPQLIGGVNTATEAEFIDDDELAESCNLMIDHGTLRTREAVRVKGGEAVLSKEGVHNIYESAFLKHPIVINGQPKALYTMITDGATTGVMLMSMDGDVEARFDTSDINGNFGVAVAPVDNHSHGTDFLVYHNGYVYVPSGDKLQKAEEDKLYAPLVMINGQSVSMKDVGEDAEIQNGKANGVMYEGYNLLTDRYRAQFTPRCEATANTPEAYCLPTRVEPGSDLTFHVITADGEAQIEVKVATYPVFEKMTIGGNEYEVGAYPSGLVRVSPPLPVSDIANTVTITCKMERSGRGSFRNKANLAVWFGGTNNKRGGTRLFLADAQTPKLMWSDVNNPFYFPENNYMLVGDASQEIKAIEKQGDMLVVFKEREIFYTTYVQGEIDTEAVANGVNVDVTAAQAYFPLTQLSPQIGCRCPHSIALCRDRLVWMDEDARIYTLVVSGAYSERNVREIGQKIRPWILEKTNVQQRRRASAIDHNGKYRLMIGDVMAEFDYNDSGFVNVSGYSSGERAARNIAWMTHRYEFGENAVQTMVSDGADKALIISEHRKTRDFGENKDWFIDFTTTAYAFDNAFSTDRYLLTDDSGGYTAEERDIPVSLTTKTYEFGDSAAYKRIHALYPMLQTDDAELSFVTDGEKPPYGKRYRSPDTFAHVVLPGVRRCRTFALKLQAFGKLCLKGLRMEYSMFGNVK